MLSIEAGEHPVSAKERADAVDSAVRSAWTAIDLIKVQMADALGRDLLCAQLYDLYAADSELGVLVTVLERHRERSIVA